eukprot:3837063-Pyramimonas_sp.AAC.1
MAMRYGSVEAALNRRGKRVPTPTAARVPTAATPRTARARVSSRRIADRTLGGGSETEGESEEEDDDDDELLDISKLQVPMDMHDLDLAELYNLVAEAWWAPPL